MNLSKFKPNSLGEWVLMIVLSPLILIYAFFWITSSIMLLPLGLFLVEEEDRKKKGAWKSE